MPRKTATRGQQKTQEGYIRITIGLITTGVGIGMMFVPVPLVQTIGAALAAEGLAIIATGTEILYRGAMLRLSGGASDAPMCSTVQEALHVAHQMKARTLPRRR